MQKIKNILKKYYLVIAVLVTIGIITVGFFLASTRDGSSPNTANTSNLDSINYNPASKEDRETAQTVKNRIVEEDKKAASQQDSSAPSIKTVAPVITFAGQTNGNVEVGAYVPGIFEESGICTAIFTRADKKITRNVTGVREGNAVHCPIFTIGKSEFPEKGSWNLIVSYEHTSAAGSSQPREVEVK